MASIGGGCWWSCSLREAHFERTFLDDVTLGDVDATGAGGTVFSLGGHIEGPHGIVEASPVEVLAYLRAGGASDVSLLDPA